MTNSTYLDSDAMLLVLEFCQIKGVILYEWGRGEGLFSPAGDMVPTVYVKRFDEEREEKNSK